MFAAAFQHMDYLIVLSVVLLISFVSAFFWGIRGAIVCQLAPYVILLVAVLVIPLVIPVYGPGPRPSLLYRLGGAGVFIGLVGIPLMVAAFISSALGIALRSVLRRRFGR